MINIAKQIIKYYLINNKKPSKENIEVTDFDLFDKKWILFVTLYKNWEIIWSSWNIVEIEKNILDELIENIVWALNDNRFPRQNKDDISKIKIRIDLVTNKSKFKDDSISNLNPVKNGIVCIKNDYSKMAIILPNISSKITNWKDFIPVLSEKLNEEFNEKNYINFYIETDIITDY